MSDFMWKFLGFKHGEDHTKENTKKSIKLNYDNIPKHIAIIMDGNGRWAKKRNLPRSFGHKVAVENLNKIVKETSDLGIKYLTLYAFSTENWNRPPEEVNTLMKLLVEYLKGQLNELHKNNVILKTIGDISKLPNICIKVLEEAIEKTKNNTGMTLNLALNYGGRDEILYALKNIFNDYEKRILSKDDINNITVNMFNDYLYTKNVPDPDIIIRTSGEQRLSNFMLWQCAYSEFWYSDVNWPDFDITDLQQAIADYQTRDRRFGRIK